MYYHIFVYDKEELQNEEIIISSLIIKDNYLTINTLKNDLLLRFYFKVYYFPF